jgi:hypothetical protein
MVTLLVFRSRGGGVTSGSGEIAIGSAALLLEANQERSVQANSATESV